MTTFAADSNATVKDSFAGKTIKLSSDIDLANKAWTPIGNFVYDISTNGDGYTEGASFQGTFDGQGHTISNLYINAPETSGIGLFGCVKGATIKGVTVKNAKLNGLSHVAAIVARSFTYNVNTTVTDCHLTGEIELNAYWAYLGGIVGKASALTLTNCSVIPEGTGSITSENRNAVGSVLGWIENASTITNCKAQNMNLTGWANIGGITGFVSGGSIVEGCSAENIILTKTRADGHPSIGLVSGGWNGKPITLKNNTVKNVTLIGNFIAGSETNILHGADFYGSMDNSGFILENNTTENITNNLGEVTRITDGLVQKKDGTYQIYNAAGLSSLSGAKISGTYAMIADIDLGGAEFKAMSAWYKSATFIGNGHTISNVKIVSGENDNGTEQASLFFVSTNGSLTVSDLTVKDITVTTKNVDNGYAAAIIGYCEGAAVLDNVDVVNATVTGSKSSGLVIGHLTPAGSLTATDCDVTGSVTVSDYEANGHYAGKLIGTIAGNVALNNVTYKATIGGNLNAKNVGDIYGRQVSGSLTVDGAKVASDAASLKEGLAAGEDVVLATDVNTEAATTAPYGNKYAVKLDGGVLDGNGHELYMECYGDDYGIMTTGGTIKNITIQEGCRAVMIMYPTQDIIIDNANIGGDGVLYPINTGEAGAAGVKLIVTNSTLAGWTSYGLIESASFTNVKFEQGTYYNNIYGRVLKPYVNTTLTNCSFVAHMNLDLSALGQGQKITMVNCTVDGQPVNAATFTIPSTDAEYDTELFTVDLPSWASSINDCIVFG